MKMWSLGKLLFILFAPRRAAELIYVSGYENSDAIVSCSYANYEMHEKYLCRDPCGDHDVLIKTTERKRSRYSVHDDSRKHMFTTTISNLSFMDKGKYWCGVSKVGLDLYLAEVILNVVRDSCCEQISTVEGSESSSVSITCEYEPKYQDRMKYLCRKAPPSTCLKQALVTSNSNHSDGRIAMSDQNGKFTVTISHLTREDSGSYLCGVHTNAGLDDFSAVRLEVKVSQTTSITTVETATSSSLADKPDEGASFFLTVVFIVSAALLLLLTLTVAVVVVHRKKRRKQQGDGVAVSRVAMDAAEDSIYEVEDAKSSTKQRPPKQQSACQASDDSDPDYENINATDNIYCNHTFAENYRRQEMKAD